MSEELFLVPVKMNVIMKAATVHDDGTRLRQWFSAHSTWRDLESRIDEIRISPVREVHAFLKRISRWLVELSKDELKTFMVQDAKKIEVELHKLFNLCEENMEIKRLLQQHGIERSDMFMIYYLLKSHGANTTVNNRYIAASALIDPATLRFLLFYYRNRRFVVNYSTEADSARIIVAYLLHYYQHGDTEGLMTA